MARDYDIAKASNACGRCRRELAPGEAFVAALFDDGEAFRREDFCAACWEARAEEPGEPRPFSTWQCRVPTPEAPRRRLVGDEVLIDFFERLDGQDEPGRVNLRFVLALMLMRKKVLTYDRADSDEDGREVWAMHYRTDETPVRVVNPHLDEQQIADVAGQLGGLFEVST